MKIRFWCVSLLVLLGTTAAWSQAGDPGYKPATRTFALKNATVVVKPGQVLQGATVVVREGLIHAVGTNVAIPADARVIAADSMFVYAGFIDALSHAGIPQRKEDPAAAMQMMRQRVSNAANPTNEQAGIQPEIKAREVVSAQEKSLEDLRKLGFAAAHVVPQGRMLPGSGAIFLTAGNSADEMLLKDQTSMFATFNGARGVYPSTVIGVNNPKHTKLHLP
jgi:imidazolonepropionase-like amidohydrolase